MNALQSYSSDESECEVTNKSITKMGDPGTNYDDVGMDISEGSDDDGTASHSLQNANRKRDELPKQNDVKHEENASEVSKANDRKDSNYKRRERSRERSTSSKDLDDKRTAKERVSSSWRSRDRDRDRKDYRRGSRDERHSRKTRSRSRDRRKSRSRSRSRDRRRRSRSRDRDRRKPHEIRKEAQQRLAAFKASNPDYDHNEMLKRGMEAQFAEVQKTTGVTLPSYYNPAVMNPLKIAEQERKKRLLWGNKSKPAEVVAAATIEPVVQPVTGDPKQAGLWANTKFSNDSDGKMAEKFKRLMGVKAAGTSSQGEAKPEQDILQKQESMFTSMEKQYEMARLATHTHKGFGLGFSSQPYVPKQ